MPPNRTPTPCPTSTSPLPHPLSVLESLTKMHNNRCQHTPKRTYFGCFSLEHQSPHVPPLALLHSALDGPVVMQKPPFFRALCPLQWTIPQEPLSLHFPHSPITADVASTSTSPSLTVPRTPIYSMSTHGLSKPIVMCANKLYSSVGSATQPYS